MGAIVAGGLTGLLNQSSAQVIDGSLKFDGVNQHLTKTPSGAGNRRTFTLSYWIKESGKGTSPYNNPHILWSGTGTATRGGFAHRGTGSDAGKLYLFNQESNSTNCQVWTNSLHRDFSAWKHIVLAVDTTQATSTDRVKIYINGTQETLTFSTTPAENLELQINIAQVHQIGRGTPDDYGNYYLSQPYFIDGLALGPESFGYTDPLTNTWRPKKYTGDFNGPSSGSGTVYSSTSTANNAATMFDGSTSTYASSALNSGSYQTVTEASITFTSGSFTYNTNNCGSTGGSSNRYLRLTRQSDGATTEITVNDCNGWTIPTEYRNTIISKIEWKRWSSFENVSAVYVDGTMLVNAIVNPAGVNGFYLPMDGNSPIGEDKSGQGNNWTPVNFSGTSIDPDVLKDSPSGAVSGGRAQTGITTTSSAPSNYPTWSPLAKGNINLSDGNLTATPASNDQSCFATLSIPDNGKVYFEFTCIQRGGGGAQSPILGVGNPSGVTLALNPQNSDNNASTWLYGGDGNKTGGGSGSTSYGSAFVAGDTIGVCVDRSNSRIWFSKNNVWQNSGNPNNQTDSNAAFTNVTSTGTLIPFYGNNNGTAGYGSVNFGQKPFKYAPPQGFLPLNSASATPETVIVRPDQYVGVTTYTGTGNPLIVPGLNMKPDLIWIKNRGASQKHTLVDSVRTTATGEYLASSDSQAQGTGVHISGVENGISIADPNSSTIWYNDSSYDYVAWCWKAGGNKNTFNVDDVGYASAAAAGLTGGTITPTGASVGTKQGFSIIKYTGNYTDDASFSHGLGKIPKFVIVKATGQSTDWATYHSSLGLNSSMYLNSGAAAADQGTWGNTNPTTSLMYIANASRTNSNSEPYIAYLWADVPGLQKFGKYTANNNVDGPFMELGFRPAVVLIKCFTGVESWVLYDSKRGPTNFNGFYLQAQSSNAEPTENNESLSIDMLSNGFKTRGQWGSINNTNTTDQYIYAAWAEAPTFSLYGAQSNAR